MNNIRTTLFLITFSVATAHSMEKVTSFINDKKQKFRAARDKSLHNQLRKAAEDLNARRLTQLLNNPHVDINRQLNEDGPAICIAINALNKRWHSPFHDYNMRHPYKKCRLFLLTLLHNGAEVNARTIEQDTPLHLALSVHFDWSFTSNELKNLVALLLEEGADIAATNAVEETPLHLAALRGNPLPSLLACNPSLYVRDACGHSPLDNAKYDTVETLIVHAVQMPPEPHSLEWYTLIYGLLRYEARRPLEINFCQLINKLAITDLSVYNKIVGASRGYEPRINPNSVRYIFTDFVFAIQENNLHKVAWYLHNGISPFTDFTDINKAFNVESDWLNIVGAHVRYPVTLALCLQNIEIATLLIDMGGINGKNGFSALREIYSQVSGDAAHSALLHVPEYNLKRYWQNSVLPFLCSKQVAQLPRDIRNLICIEYLLAEHKDFLLSLFQKKIKREFTNSNHQSFTTGLDMIPFIPLKCLDNERNNAYQLAYEHLLDDTFMPHWKEQLNAHFKRQKLNKQAIYCNELT